MGFSVRQKEDLKRHLYGAMINLLYLNDDNAPTLDASVQSVINKLEGANVVFGDKSELCSAAALLATAVMHKDQFRKCVLDAANLIDRLGGE